ncbi:MAG: hypothetical protein ABEH88_02355, partial [Halobacteriales archaeon]
MSATATEPGARSTKWLGRVGVVLAGLGLVLVGDVFGLGAAVLLGVAWYALPAPYVVAIGHVLFAAILPAEPGVLDLLPAELGLLCMLGAAAPSRDGIARFGALLVAATVLLSGAGALGFRIGELPGAALALVAASLLGGYGLHRYELLRLGLL